jgi:Mn-dependent DtxR family transcriptional regulator
MYRPRAKEDEVEIVVTQKELADELAVSRVALGTAFGKLRQLGLLETSYGRITITNLEAIEHWVGEQSHLATLQPKE